MTRKGLIELVKTWQVALLVILLAVSVVAIYPHIDDGVTTNLQYGLDLRGGTWLQMRFQAEVVGFATDRPVSDFLTDLQKTLDAEIYLIGDNKIEIRKYFAENELKPAFTAAGGTLTSYEQGVSRKTGDQV